MLWYLRQLFLAQYTYIWQNVLDMKFFSHFIKMWCQCRWRRIRWTTYAPSTFYVVMHRIHWTKEEGSRSSPYAHANSLQPMDLYYPRAAQERARGLACSQNSSTVSLWAVLTPSWEMTYAFIYAEPLVKCANQRVANSSLNMHLRFVTITLCMAQFCIEQAKKHIPQIIDMQ